MEQNKEITNGSLFHYGFIAFPLAYCGLPLYIHAPDYYATQFGLSLSSIGFVLLLVRLFDAIQDPLIGFCLDKYKAHSTIISFFSILFLGLGFFLLYVPFGMQGLLWFGIMLMVATTSFSILSIHVNSQGSLWSKNSHEKTKISSYREFFGLLGLLLATILPTILAQSFDLSESFAIYAFLFLLILSISGLFFIKWNHKYANKNTSMHNKVGFIDTVKIIKKAQDLKSFFLVYFFSIFSSAFPAVLIIFFVRDRLGLEQYTGMFLLTYFLCAVISIPLWKKISNHVGHKKLWLTAMAMAITSFVWAFMLNSGDMWPFLLICMATGFALGAELCLPPAILSSCIDKADLGQSTSVIFSFVAFLGKMSLALATSLSFFVLDIYGFVPSGDNANDSLLALSAMYALVPCFLKIISCVLLVQWTKNKGEKYEIFKNIDHHRRPNNA